MNDHISEKQWDAHMAYYDRALRSLLELIHGTVRIMQVDGLSEAIERLGKALLEIGNAAVSWEWTASLAAGENQMEADGDTE
jgi:hypothetical protein